MIKFIQKIITMLVGMPYLYFISITNLIIGLGLCINNPNLLKDYNNLLDKNIAILRNAWKEIGSV